MSHRTVWSTIVRRKRHDDSPEEKSTKRHTIQVSYSPNLTLCRVLSDASYDKSNSDHRGSAPTSPILGVRGVEIPSPSSRRLTSFFSKRTPKNPLKRTKSVTKLERKPGTVDRDSMSSSQLRTSRSHESLLLPSPSAISSTDFAQCDIEVNPHNGNYCGREHCFKLTYNRGETRHYSCTSEEERNSWVQRLKETIHRQSHNQRRTENSLIIWIMEAKGLPVKKRYFCEVCLDEAIYDRSSSKPMIDTCFWGEHFEFSKVPEIETISVNLYRESETKRKRNKLLGSIDIPVNLVSGKRMTENRYKVKLEKNSGVKNVPSVRIKARYQSVDILPLNQYKVFRQFLSAKNKSLIQMLDPLHVVVKEDIAVTLVRIMQKENSAKEFLSTIVIDDVKKIDDQHLTFRGNSFATKASEAYMKLLGDKYLQDTLKEFVEKVLSSQDECEVDPSKVPNKQLLQQQQQNLLRFVEEAWERITRSAQNLPFEFQEVFSEYRGQLQAIDKEHICDKLISASIFLRFLCPAILSPSLFNLTQEYPEDRARRNLTLIAKTIQTLANFTRFGEKEDFMEFLNQFVDKQQDVMKNFLLQISTPGGGDSINFEGQIDLGKELSILHSLLVDCIPDMNKTEHLEDVEELQQILNDISSSLSQSSVLRQMSSPNFGDKVHNIHCLIGPTSSLPGNPEQSQRKSTINLLESKRNIKEDDLQKNVDLDLQSQVPQQVASSPTLSLSQSNILYSRTANYHKRRRSKDPAEDMNSFDDYVRFEALEKRESTCDKHSTSTSIHSTSYSETNYPDRRPATKMVDQKVPHIIDSEGTHFKGNHQPIDAKSPQKTQQGFSVLTRNLRNSCTHDYDEVTDENGYHMKSHSQNSLCKVTDMGTSRYQSVRNSKSIPSPGLSHEHVTFSSNSHYSFRPPLAFKNPMYSLNISCGSISDSEGLKEERKSNETSNMKLCNKNVYPSSPSSENDTASSQIQSFLSGSPSKLPQLSYFHSYPQLWKIHRLERRGSADQLSRSPKQEGVQVCNPHHNSSSFETKRYRTLEEYHAEIQSLKELMTDLQRKLTEAEKKLSKPDTRANRNAISRQTRLSEVEMQQINQQRHKDERFQSIITRLMKVEDELRQEHQEMQGIIANRQKVIDGQERRIQLLDAANQELTSALEHLQKQNIWSPHSCEDLLTENTKLSFRSSSC